jgi:hypothetical protein
MKPKLVLVEFDGDRAGPLNGFKIELTVGETTLEYTGLLYNSTKQRLKILTEMRGRMKKIRKALGMRSSERIFK